MTYTSHGHHVPGTTLSPVDHPGPVVACGGVLICKQCSQEATQIIDAEAGRINSQLAKQAAAREALRSELQDTLERIDLQIAEVGRFAKRQGCDSSQIQNTQGDFMLTPLLVSRANVLIAMLNLGLS